MVQINFAQKTVNVKIVYYGPGMSGKTTNLEVVHQRAPGNNRGELTSISTDGDRTLFFDYMPLDLGTVAGMRTCFQLYTVPGQVYYNSTRKLVLQGTDGVIFVADSSKDAMEHNLESLRNLEENLNEYGKSLATMPHVIQWNKRDLPDALPVEELERQMNAYSAPTFEGVANTGQGVFPTLKALAASVLKSIMQETKQPSAAAPPAPPAAIPAPAAQAAPAVQAAQAGFQAPQAAPPAAAGFAQQPPPPPPPTPPAGEGAGLDLKAPQPTAASPSGLMQQKQAARPASAPVRPVQRRPKAAPSRASASAKRSAASSPSRTPMAAPRSKGRSFLTGTFVVLAAGAGAVLAWAVLRVL